MSDTTKISWCDHTFNPWIGCSKVGTECLNCYAEALAKRWYKGAKWGPKGARHRTSKANWARVRRWNADAIARGVPGRVFCASLADVFEDHPTLDPWREDLFRLMEECTALDWMLLTKRPENVMRMVPKAWRKSWPRHVWIGTSVGTQAATARLDDLIRIPAPIRFVSAEPLIHPVDLSPWLSRRRNGTPVIDLVITGGESGGGARPMSPDWVRKIRDDCATAKVHFHHKQWGNWVPDAGMTPEQRKAASKREFTFSDGTVVRRMSPKVAGRVLDGVEHLTLPPRRKLR